MLIGYDSSAWKAFTVLRTSSGAHAEHATAPSVFTAKLPTGLSFQDGAALGVPYFTAYRALVSVGGGKKGDKVFIPGASGGVGVACMQIAKFLRMDVYGTASIEAGLSLITDHDCHPFNHREGGYFEKIKEIKFSFVTKFWPLIGRLEWNSSLNTNKSLI